MFALFEMRVRKTQENFAELGFLEEVGQEFHGVGPDAGGILVGVC